jgi:hypothetical protein
MIFGIENNIAKTMSELEIRILKDLDISGTSREQTCSFCFSLFHQGNFFENCPCMYI